VLVGQRVVLLGRDGDVTGVIGKKAIHLMDAEDRAKASKTKNLWVDVGAGSREEVAALGLRVGDPMVLAQKMVRLAGDRIASRAVDNRIGAYVVLEALRLLADDPPAASATAVATSQEEIGYSGGGARTSAYALEPQVAIVVDVTFSTDVPDVEKKELGEHKLGGGPVLSRGSASHNEVFEMLARVAEEEGISHTIQASPRSTRTDADAIYLTRSGVPTALISVPNRYMHSPSEIVSVEDLHSTARLIAAFIRRLDAKTDFTPR
jgi:endoglucanase